MDALVVVESVFGNTRQIADAVAEGLGQRVRARVVDVSAAPELATELAADADLLVVGGPTHAFGMTRPQTRRSAAEQAGEGAVPAESGLREWLDARTPAAHGRLAAAFDTRVDHPRMPGSAASAALRKLRHLGYKPVCHSETFRVGGTTGPLVPGEVERARAWGASLVATHAAGTPEPGGR